MPIRAVLFDVGGPINTEIEHERRVDAAIRAVLAAERIVVSDAEYAAASDWAVEHFAPDAHMAIIWQLAV
jgi:putative hydrolase of the HAD superfamily